MLHPRRSRLPDGSVSLDASGCKAYCCEPVKPGSANVPRQYRGPSEMGRRQQSNQGEGGRVLLVQLGGEGISHGVEEQDVEDMRVRHHLQHARGAAALPEHDLERRSSAYRAPLHGRRPSNSQLSLFVLCCTAASGCRSYRLPAGWRCGGSDDEDCIINHRRRAPLQLFLLCSHAVEPACLSLSGQHPRAPPLG